MLRSFQTSLLLAVSLLCVASYASVSVAPADEAAAPGWELTATSYPSNLPPGGRGQIEIGVYNIGAAASKGSVTVTDTLPAGLTAIEAGVHGLTDNPVEHIEWDCSGTKVVTCTNNNPGGPPISLPGGGGGFGKLGDILEAIPRITIGVEVEPGAAGDASNQVTIAGGGAVSTANTVEPIRYGSAQPGFGFKRFDVWSSNADGTIDTQAGSHPYTTTFAFALNTGLESERLLGGSIRNITVNLPSGLVGAPNATPQCSRQELDASGCPPSSQVGVQLNLLQLEAEDRHAVVFSAALYNMVPPAGVAAEFAFNFNGVIVTYDSSVRTSSDNKILTRIDNVPQRAVIGSSTTIWGVPADPSHNPERKGVGCAEDCPAGVVAKPFFTMPSECASPREFSIEANTWENADVTAEASSLTHDSNGAPAAFVGCEALNFDSSLTLAPDTASADTPAGLTTEVRPILGGLELPKGLSASDLEDAKVTLPVGVAINPGQAAGLVACQPSQDAVGTEEAPSCPAASKVGTVQITTPLIQEKLEGTVYILPPNPPNLQVLIAASAEGVNLKIVGDIHLDPSTGQLTATFTKTPPFPFSNFKLSFSGGAQAALTTPTTCGVYTANADFTPWASPFVSDILTNNSFGVEAGPGNGACPSVPLPFSPQMIAGSTTDQAGGYTSFSLLLQRADAQQRIADLQFTTPEGLLGMISKIPLCPEPQASLGTCSAESQIGHTVVAAGPGPYPLVVPQPGQPPAPIYLTGAYKGAPFGLSIAVPVIAGPFNLGTVVVRASIAIDPLTSRLTVTTDQLPLILDGVPTDLRTINAVIDRPGFMFNPTSCAPQSFSGTASSAQGVTAAISSHFQMGSCQSLKFDPDFRVSTSGRTSRKDGASLDVRVIYPTGALGDNQASSQSNIAAVKVDLPKQLPSRLSTLQKACTAAQFASNPAGCPVESRIGVVKAITPVLPVPLTGPVYFVSHGGEEFPQLVMILQGYGIRVDLVASTFISKAGITSSTLKAVPDVPITSFELYLPEGPYSALAANGNLCKSKLAMPTAFTGQNGAVIHESTKISVTGCAKAKTAKAARDTKSDGRAKR
jgi:uncharacterized repeat protein (TIGR01451 family)